MARRVQCIGSHTIGDRIVPASVFHALVFWLPVFLFSTTVHEAAHAWAALRSVRVAARLLLCGVTGVPSPPLDGASVLALALPAGAARSLRRAIATPGLSVLGMVAAWQLFPACAKPILSTLADLLYPGT